MINWRSVFPEKQPRDTQAQILDTLTEKWNDYDYFIVEAPTGVGKSAIGFCLSRWVSKMFESGGDPYRFQGDAAYLTTINLALQEVYEKSYGDSGLLKLYSADNFTCVLPPDELTCGEARRSPRHSSPDSEKSCEGRCPYVAAKQRFIRGKYGVLNFPYYLNETYYAGQLVPRRLLVVDEAHSLPDALRDFSSLDFTPRQLEEYVLQPPTFRSDNTMNPAAFRKWLEETCFPKVKALHNTVKEQVANFKGSDTDPRFLDLLKKEARLDRAVCRYFRIIKLMENEDNWVVETDSGVIKATPLSSRPFAGEALFNRESGKCLLMSATILDPDFYRRELNLPKEKTFTIQVSSPFPKENREIYFYPAGKIDYRDVEGSLRDFKEAIDLLLKEHSGERGIIFVSSYNQARCLVSMLGNPRVRTHSNSLDRMGLMIWHENSPDGVLVSPSMHEGVDLKDDLSRFQIILKLPFPSLGSKVVRKRMNQDPEWYAMQVALKLVQSTGRSVRSETDWSKTYILDQSFGNWYSRWNHILPAYWKDSLVEV